MIIINTTTKENLFEISGKENCNILLIENDKGVSFEDEVCFDLKVQKTSKDIIISGKASTIVSFECARCLGAFKKDLLIGSIIYAYDLNDLGDTVDITPQIREEFLLMLPIIPICSKECKGICSVCGINLNESMCKCSEKKVDSPFDILDQLKKNKN